MPRSVGRNRQPATLSGSMCRNLSLYALAAGAAGVELLALAQPSDAEVVFTPAHQVIGRNQAYAIDLNHDGITDFAIRNGVSVRSGYEHFDLTAVPAGAGSIVRTTISSFAAAALKKGTSIGPANSFLPLPLAMAVYDIVAYGAWLNVSKEYLGLCFRIGGIPHYGWARLSVRWNGGRLIVAELSGYAYETDPNKRIIAGDTGGALDNEEQAKPISGNSFPQPKAQPVGTLAALSLGAPGLTIWRRPTR
jgi:hypothetical protein